VKSILPESAFRSIRKIGPYALLELLLPGGTVLAFLLWLSTGAGRGLFAEEHPPRIRPATAERVVASPAELRGGLRVPERSRLAPRTRHGAPTTP
jgi:hypothetical protein